MSITVRPKALEAALEFSFKNKLPVLIKGAPGIGKSDIVAQAAKAAGFQMIVSHPVVSDPTDFKGLPFPSQDKASADFLPFGDLKALVDATTPTVFFLDDLGQAPMSVQAACMQLLLARRVNNHKVSDEVVFVAATNGRKDKAGVSGILEPVKSRFASILELEPKLDDWVEWAIQNNMPFELISFIRFRPNLLHDFKATSDLVNQPCPRTVAFVGKILNGLSSSGSSEEIKNMRRAMIAGAVGEGFAAEFDAYLSIYSKLPTLTEFLTKPTEIPIPVDDPAVMFAFSGFVAANNSVKNIPQLMKFISRMPEEYQVLIIRDTIKGSHKGIQSTKEYQDWAIKNAHLVI